MLINSKLSAAGFPNAELKLRNHLDYFKKPDKPVYLNQNIEMVNEMFSIEKTPHLTTGKGAFRNPLRRGRQDGSRQGPDDSSQASAIYEQYKRDIEVSVFKAKRPIDFILEKKSSTHASPHSMSFSDRPRIYRSSESIIGHQSSSMDRQWLAQEITGIENSKVDFSKFRFRSMVPPSSKQSLLPSLHFKMVKRSESNHSERQSEEQNMPKKTLKDLIGECRSLNAAEDRMKGLEEAKAKKMKDEDGRRREVKNLDREREAVFKNREWKQIMTNKVRIEKLADWHTNQE